MHQHRYPQGSKPAESSSGPAEKALLRSHSSVSNSLELTSPRYSLERAQWSHGTWPEFSGCLNPPNWWHVHPLTLKQFFFPYQHWIKKHLKWHQFGIQIMSELLLDGSAAANSISPMGSFMRPWAFLSNRGDFWKKNHMCDTVDGGNSLEIQWPPPGIYKKTL